MSESTGSEIPTRIDPTKIKMVPYNGMMMPQTYEHPEVYLPKVKNLQLRDSDVMLSTYPKSGTHWLWRVLDMLVHGSAEYGDRVIDNTVLDFMPTEVIDKAESPRILLTHLPFDLLPEKLKDGRVKVVHVYRHPKAVLVSLFFQMMKVGHIPDMTLETLMNMMASGKAPMKSQSYYFDTVQEYEKSNPNVSIFHLAYEDMKEDPVSSIKKLAAHLNVEASDELCSQIAEAVTFNNQKKEEEKRAPADQNAMNFYRKGEASGWKNHLTVAQSERMDQMMRERAPTCPFFRRYCSSD
ncbi:amine sulfotransferase-like [Littorina saxatilis]|uniref:Sulfotransferase domain-containing protein n=1 Tax=Littorina saxatilis TaxID=31220 RepID=A0AAN9AK75_9CAEN